MKDQATTKKHMHVHDKNTKKRWKISFRLWRKSRMRHGGTQRSWLLLRTTIIMDCASIPQKSPL